MQSAGYSGWLAPLWRFATFFFLTILSFFKVGFTTHLRAGMVLIQNKI